MTRKVQTLDHRKVRTCGNYFNFFQELTVQVRRIIENIQFSSRFLLVKKLERRAGQPLALDLIVGQAQIGVLGPRTVFQIH